MIDTISVALVILLNMLPYAILCYIPFTAHLKVSKKIIAVYLAVLSPAVIILTFLYTISPFNIPGAWGLAQILLLFIYAAVGFLTIKSTVSKFLYVFITVSSYAYCNAGISYYIESTIFAEQFVLSYNPTIVIIRLTVLTVTYPFAVLFFRKLIRPAINTQNTHVWKYMWFVPLVFASVIVVYTGAFEIAIVSTTQYLIVLLLLMFGSFLTYYFIIKLVEQSNLSTQMAALANELAARKKSQDMFFQNISHDLRTPISVIRTAADILSENELPPSEQRLVSRITGRVTQLENMVEDFMKLAIIESGQSVFKTELIDIEDLLHAVRDGHINICEKQGVELNITALSGTIYSDRHRILEVFDNLISNALRYMQTGNISISAKQDSKFCIFTVRDTGTGIPEKDLPYIFDRFFKGIKSKDGNGLGLCICKEIVEHLGGTIKAENHSESGAVFTFSIKLSSEQQI